MWDTWSVFISAISPMAKIFLAAGNPAILICKNTPFLQPFGFQAGEGHAGNTRRPDNGEGIDGSWFLKPIVLPSYESTLVFNSTRTPIFSRSRFAIAPAFSDIWGNNLFGSFHQVDLHFIEIKGRDNL